MAGRITIEPYKPLGVRPTPVPGGGYIEVDASAGAFAPAPLAQRALQGAQAAIGIARAVADQFARDDETAVKLADMRLGEAEQTLLFDPQAGYLNTRGGEALAQAPAVLRAYGAAQEQALATMAGDAQRRMLDDLAQRRLAAFADQVEHHSAVERIAWHDDASRQRVAHMQADAALSWRDDARLRRALGTARAELHDQAARYGWSEALTAKALRRQTSRILAGAIEAAAGPDPDRAETLRAVYDRHIEDADRAAIDPVLAEARIRRRAAEKSRAILDAAPPADEPSATSWRQRQADAIDDPALRAATLSRLASAAADAETHARALAERVLARVLEDGLTDTVPIAARDWVALDAPRRAAIAARIEHNAAGTEPAPDPALLVALATEATHEPARFTRRDLVPLVARLPLPHWRRTRDWQDGLRRDDTATHDALHAVRRGLQLATKILPPDTTADAGAADRAELIDDIDTWRRVNGRSPDDDDIRAMLARYVPTTHTAHTLEWDPQDKPEIHLANADTTMWGPGPAVMRALEKVLGATLKTVGRAIILNDAMRAMQRMATLDQIDEIANVLELEPATIFPERIKHNGEAVYYDRVNNRYLVRNRHGNGFWAEFDKDGKLIGTIDMSLTWKVPRTALHPDLAKIFQNPPPIPPIEIPHIIPGRPIEPVKPLIEGIPDKGPSGPSVVHGPPTDAPAGPSILTFPANPPSKPQVMESQGASTDSDEPRQIHHHVPQQWWQLGKPNRFPFSWKARKFFDELTVEVPQSEHWGKLHAAYNREFGRALEAYLDRKAMEYGKTPQQYAEDMDRKQAEELYNEIIAIIRNPELHNRDSLKGATPENAEKIMKDRMDAKTFADKMFSYQSKKASILMRTQVT